MIFDYPMLKRAWKDTVTQSSEEHSKAHYRYFLIPYLYKLSEKLSDGSFKPSSLKLMTVMYPKERIVQVPTITDKIVQHAICDNYLTDVLEVPLIKEVSACITGRGDDYASKILKGHLRSYYAKHKTNQFYVLKCDIKSFFATVPHDQMFKMLDRCVPDPDVLRLVKKFINIMPDGIGMALGLQQSHICGNLYLSDLDHFCKEKLGAKMYARHMDDFYIISDDVDYLKYCLSVIDVFVEKKGLKLNPKTKIAKSKVEYLGFEYHITETGKIVKSLLKSKKRSKHRHINKMLKQVEAGEKTVEEFLMSYNGWRVHALRGDCHALVREWDLNLVRWFKCHKKIDIKILKKGLIVLNETGNQ